MNMVGAQVLILEFISSDRFFNANGELLPFISAGLQDLGHKVGYLAFGYDPWAMAESPFSADLPESELAGLAGLLQETPVDLVVSNLAPGPRVVAALRDLAPEAPIVAGTREGIFLHPEFKALGLDLPDINAARILPDYSCIPANASAEQIRPVVTLLGGSICLNGRTLTNNPFYQGEGLPSARDHKGCAFCMHPSEVSKDDVKNSVRMALGQLQRVKETMPGFRLSHHYQLDNAVLFFRLKQFAQGVLDLGLPPSVFLISCRIDEFLRSEAMIEEVLNLFIPAGHQLAVSNMGVENFSEKENLRLNKGITFKDVEQVQARLNHLEQKYPDNFSFWRFGGFGYILFTPWTRIEDLRINLAAARELEIANTNHFFTTRLILMPGTPITELAARDGLIKESFDFSGGVLLGAECVFFSVQDRELPWRFQDPRIGLLYSIMYRMNPASKIPEGDPELALVKELLSSLPEENRNYYHVVPRLLDLLESNPELTDIPRVAAALREAHKLESPAFESAGVAALLRLSELVTSEGGTFPGGFLPEPGRREKISGVRDGVVFQSGSQQLAIAVRPISPEERFFFQGRAWGVLHAGETPPESDEALAFMKELIPLLEFFLEQGRLPEPGADPGPGADDPDGLLALTAAVGRALDGAGLGARISSIVPRPGDEPRVEVEFGPDLGNLVVTVSRLSERGRYFHHQGTIGVGYLQTGTSISGDGLKLVRRVGDLVSALVDG